MIGAKVERERKGAQHQLDPLGDLPRDMGEQERVRLDLRRKARAPGAEQLAVEQQALVAHMRVPGGAFRMGAMRPIIAVMPTGEAELAP